MDHVAVLLRCLPSEKRKAIIKILKKKNGIQKVNDHHYLVMSSTYSDLKYDVTYYNSKKKFVCTCEGFVKTIELIGKKFKTRNITNEQKDFLEKNFKCIHIYSVFLFLIKNR